MNASASHGARTASGDGRPRQARGMPGLGSYVQYVGLRTFSLELSGPAGASERPRQSELARVRTVINGPGKGTPGRRPHVTAAAAGRFVPG